MPLYLRDVVLQKAFLRHAHTLYYHAGACSLAAHIVIACIGEPAYLAINPAAAVPALDAGEG